MQKLKNVLIEKKGLGDEINSISVADLPSMCEIPTEYQLANKLKKKGWYVPPVEYVLCRTQKTTYQYVPLARSLSELVKNPCLFPYFIRQNQSEHGQLYDYHDTEKCQVNASENRTSYPTNRYIYIL